MNSLKFFLENQEFKKSLFKWYPGHMASGLRDLQSLFNMIDCVIEVHDARIPLTGRNPKFLHDILANKLHLLVLNKSDLIDESKRPSILRKIKEDVKCCEFAQIKCEPADGIRIFKTIKNLLEKDYRTNENNEYNIAVVGIPNVGKSTLINKLRNNVLNLKAKALPVGAKPGVTTTIMNRVRISENPLIYMIDTPGILEPSVRSIKTGCKLTLTNCIKYTQESRLTVAAYLLHYLNAFNHMEYMKYYSISTVPMTLNELLIYISKSNKLISEMRDIQTRKLKRVYDIETAADKFINDFNKGYLGKVLLDEEYFLTNQ